MTIKIKIAVLSLFLVSTAIIGQEKTEKKAKEEFNQYAYMDAITLYEELVKKGYTSMEIYKNLGNANYFNANYEEAANWYEKLFNLNEVDIAPDYIYRYAQSLKSIGKYSESDKWMQKIKAIDNNNIRASMFTESLDYLKKIEQASGRYVIKNIAINSEESDFSPSFYKKHLVFSTARDTGLTSNNIDKWTNKSFLNLHKAKIDAQGELIESEKLSKKINTKTHESSSTFTKDGTTMYFTRNNSKEGKFSRDKAGISRLKIFKATLIDGEWKNVIELPFNHDDYSVAHPALSSDEKKLYFASDMPGSLGMTDIFVVDILADGSYGTPKNLGSTINTEGRETFPFISEKNILYFASDSHPGLGGLDIFATKLDEIYPVNLGKPANSSQDDFSFIFNETKKTGYFASNRAGGKGSDDIYSFTESSPLDLSCTKEITGVVLEANTMKTLGKTAISLYDATGDVIAKTISDDEGHFSINVKCKKASYDVVGQKTDYNNGSSYFVVSNQANLEDIELILEPIKKTAIIGTDLVKYLNIKPIHFDLDKSFIRDSAKKSMEKIISYLLEFPNVNVEVRSHTDAWATNKYNQALSERRAKKTIAYLVKNGISKNRLRGQGFGETTLLNNCTTGKKCKEEKHQKNRRSEFIIVK